MRGDPPAGPEHSRPLFASTPHARGSTLKRLCLPVVLSVYPACAGIHLTTSQLIIDLLSLPRMRGDPPLSARL